MSLDPSGMNHLLFRLFLVWVRARLAQGRIYPDGVISGESKAWFFEGESSSRGSIPDCGGTPHIPQSAARVAVWRESDRVWGRKSGSSVWIAVDDLCWEKQIGIVSWVPIKAGIFSRPGPITEYTRPGR